MTTKQRQVIFYLLVLAFLLLGTGAAFYAQGWRLDWNVLGVDKIGGIYIRSYPTEASIYLDDEPQKNKAGIFQSGTLLDGLFPRTYKLSLTAPGYLDWTRQVSVQPSMVAEIEHAVLIPTESKLVLAGPLTNFWLLGKNPLLRDTKGILHWQGKAILGDSVLNWNEDLTSLLTRNSKTGSVYLTNLSDATSTNLSALAQKAAIKSPSFILSPEDNPSVVTQSPTAIGLLNSRSGRFTLLATSTASEPLGPIAASRFWLAWSKFDKTRQASFLTLYDKLLGTTRTLAAPLAGKTEKLIWGNGSALGILQNDGEAYVYFLGSSDITHLASDGLDFVFAAGGDKLAVMENKALEVFSLNSKDYWRFNLPNIGDVIGLHWYKDGFNLFIEYPGKVSFLGLEDAGLDTFQTVVKSSKTVYEPAENKFYYIQDGALYALNFPS